MTIVRDLKDLSLPSIPEGDYSLVVRDYWIIDEQLTENVNSDLVTKQRTQSIDRSLEAGMPRSYSVDSVDYTTMLMGDMPEEVKEEARKRRRNRKPKRLWDYEDELMVRDYSKVLGKNSVSGEVKKGQHGNRHEEKKGKWSIGSWVEFVWGGFVWWKKQKTFVELEHSDDSEYPQLHQWF